MEKNYKIEQLDNGWVLSVVTIKITFEETLHHEREEVG